MSVQWLTEKLKQCRGEIEWEKDTPCTNMYVPAGNGWSNDRPW